MDPMKNETKNSWANEVNAITLFVEDIDNTRKFYIDQFGLTLFFEDSVSIVFKVGNLLINFLKVSAADELIAPAKVGSGKSDSLMVLTIYVKDVDVKYTELKAHGVDFLLAPLDRPWGVRTANFTDPGGYIWEIATPIDN